MSPQVVILIVQTAIGAVTTGVIAWYTWVTYRLHKSAQDQTRVLRDQLDVAKQELKMKTQRERKDAEPIIRYQCGTNTRQKIRCVFQNVGAQIFDLEIAHRGDVEASLTARQNVLRGEDFAVDVQAPTQDLPSSLPFEIHYSTRLDERFAKHFELQTSSGIPTEVKTVRI